MKKRYVVEVDIAGTRQKYTLETVEETTPFGRLLLLDARPYSLPEKELIKIAERYGIPVIAKNNIKYFPPNKTAKDLAR